MSDRIYIWDRFVRVFHWTLAAAFCVAYASGEENASVHAYAGYLVLGLVASRIVWGLLGPRHARFASFVRGPAAVLGYLRGLAGHAPLERHLGHNPAGGWMVLALLACLTLTTVSGVVVYGIEGHGPLASLAAGTTAAETHTRAAHRDDAAEEVWEEIHEAAANLTLGLVLLHVGGVAVSSLRHRENLVRAMFSGYKRR